MFLIIGRAFLFLFHFHPNHFTILASSTLFPFILTLFFLQIFVKDKYISLVQDIEHTILPNIPPVVTFLATFLTMIPALVKLWLSPNSVTGWYLSFFLFFIFFSLSSFYTFLYFFLSLLSSFFCLSVYIHISFPLSPFFYLSFITPNFTYIYLSLFLS